MRSFTVSTAANASDCAGAVSMCCPHSLCLSSGDIASGCKLLRNRFESKDREWASYTCVLGFHVMGEESHRSVVLVTFVFTSP